MYTFKGIIKRGRFLKLRPFLFFPIENYKEVEYLPVKEGFFNCDLRIVNGKIKAVIIRKYFFPNSSPSVIEEDNIM